MNIEVHLQGTVHRLSLNTSKQIFPSTPISSASFRTTGRIQVSRVCFMGFVDVIHLLPSLVPPGVEHTLVWSRVPIFHPALVPSSIEARIQQNGLCGFTGSNTSAEQLPSLESCLPTLAEWGITIESIRIPRGSEEDEEMVRNAGKEVSAFVKRRWQENKWETAWFVNPPVRPLLLIHLPSG